MTLTRRLAPALWLAALAALGLSPARPAAAQATLTVLASFSGANGAHPQAALTGDGQGGYFGTALDGGPGGGGTLFHYTAGSGIDVLAGFSAVNSSEPSGRVLSDGQGNLYGTTETGAGTIYRYNAATGLVTLASFPGVPGGQTPLGGVVADGQGNLYGTTLQGGASFSHGTIFRYSPATGLSTAFSFNSINGNGPKDALVPDGQGNFYGITSSGGLNGMGSIFRYTPGAGLTSLASFPFSLPGGQYPQGDIAPDGQGGFYGTTFSGGAIGVGSVFHYSAATGLTTAASFNGTTLGMDPRSGLVTDGRGNFYGTTEGLAGGQAVVYRFNPATGLTALASFAASPSGQYDTPGLVIDGQGNLFGVSPEGGAYGDGYIFEVSPAPEPSQIAALALGALGLAALRIRARRRQRVVPIERRG